jgi:hypothetical protein
MTRLIFLCVNTEEKKNNKKKLFENITTKEHPMALEKFLLCRKAAVAAVVE